MCPGEEKGERLSQHHGETVRDAIEWLAGSPGHAADVSLAGAEPASLGWSVWSLANRRPGSRSPCAAAAERAEPTPPEQPELRTTVPVGELTVTGVLPGTPALPVGSIAIGGDVSRLSCDEALELVDALLLVVLRIDEAAEQRYGVAIPENRERED